MPADAVACSHGAFEVHRVARREPTERRLVERFDRHIDLEAARTRFDDGQAGTADGHRFSERETFERRVERKTHPGPSLALGPKKPRALDETGKHSGRTYHAVPEADAVPGCASAARNPRVFAFLAEARPLLLWTGMVRQVRAVDRFRSALSFVGGIAATVPSLVARAAPDEETQRVSTLQPADRARELLPLLALCLYAVVIVKAGWLADDAFASFRAASNLVNGYGLVSNPPERVQAFTNPLWTLLFALAYWPTKNAYAVGIVMGLVASLATVAVIAFSRRVEVLARALAVLTLALSQAFVDFSTSGLENPLSHLLLVRDLRLGAARALELRHRAPLGVSRVQPARSPTARRATARVAARAERASRIFERARVDGARVRPARPLGALRDRLLRLSAAEHRVLETQRHHRPLGVRESGAVVLRRIGVARSAHAARAPRGRGGAVRDAQVATLAVFARNRAVPRVRAARRRRFHGRALFHGSARARRRAALSRRRSRAAAAIRSRASGRS